MWKHTLDITKLHSMSDGDKCDGKKVEQDKMIQECWWRGCRLWQECGKLKACRVKWHDQSKPHKRGEI